MAQPAITTKLLNSWYRVALMVYVPWRLRWLSSSNSDDYVPEVNCKVDILGATRSPNWFSEPMARCLLSMSALTFPIEDFTSVLVEMFIREHKPRRKQFN
jgi:hypothetical protein